MENTKLELEEIRKKMLELADQISLERLYFELRRIGISHFSRSMPLIVACIVLTENDLPIRARTVGWLLGKDPPLMVPGLHTLGDKHLLTLVRRHEKELHWVASPILKDVMEKVSQ